MLKKIKIFFKYWFLIIFLFPVGIVLLAIIRLIRPFILIRWKQLMSTRIGHFAINTELYLCERDNKINIPSKKYIDFFYFAAAPVSNKQLAKMWKRVLKILPTPIMRSVEITNNLIPGGEIHKIKNNASGAIDVHGLLDKTEAHIKFNEKEEKYGQAFLKNMGLRYLTDFFESRGFLTEHKLLGYLDKVWNIVKRH